jgi:hypothetical protein
MQYKWGVVRYPSNGSQIYTGPASFEGWYKDKPDAELIRDFWTEKYPDHAVMLVELNEARIPAQAETENG